MNTDDFTTVTVKALADAPNPHLEAFHLTNGSLDAVDLLGGPDASGFYALRLMHKPCRFMAGPDTLLHVRNPA